MGKSLFIAEKPSVGQQFAAALGENLSRKDGYLEGENMVVTWCVGHLVTMSYPEVYDEKYKRWRLEDLPFIPKEYKYEVIKSSAKQYGIVSGLMKRDDVETIYVCTDSGREGEYIYRLVEQMAGIEGKTRKRVWIDSQTEEEIRRGVREAKDLDAYDNLSDSAYLRAKEDYLMGINFSRILSIRYGNSMASFLGEKYCSIAAGRVMTCVLGMIVRREREIRDFEKTPFYRVLAGVDVAGANLSMEWKAVVGSRYENSPLLYKENGFKKEEDAIGLMEEIFGLEKGSGVLDDEKRMMGASLGTIEKIEKKKEKKNPPLLYNLAELQNDCSKFFKISPDETLAVIQELYEKKLVTYPRTDARVLSTAVAKEITKNIKGLLAIPGVKPYAETILENKYYAGIEKSRYVNDKQITDHYAIIPTGQGLGALKGLNQRSVHIYEAIVRRFLAIFYPAAEYEKLNLTIKSGGEFFFASEKYLKVPGYLQVMEYSFRKKKSADASADAKSSNGDKATSSGEADTEENPEEDENAGIDMAELVSHIKKGDTVDIGNLQIKEGETSPPKRYNSGAMILAMENAGQLIEDEELRSQIKGSGIGTSATRAEILKKLVEKKYISLNKKTQIYTPTLMGEMIFDVVSASIPSLLNPELTASWEKGLTYVAEGKITADEYMVKLENFINQKSARVIANNNQSAMMQFYKRDAAFYKK